MAPDSHPESSTPARSRSPHGRPEQVQSSDAEDSAKRRAIMMEKVRAARDEAVKAAQMRGPESADGEAAPEGSGGYNAETQDKIRRYEAAKQSKDFATSDALRNELRAQGVEPDNPNTAKRKADSTIYDAEIEAKISRWSAAKKAKDFGIADALRSELRSKDIDPEKVLRSREPPNLKNLSFGYDAETDAKINRWAAAKRNRDFATADALRTELRLQKIEVDEIKPLAAAPTSKDSGKGKAHSGKGKADFGKGKDSGKGDAGSGKGKADGGRADIGKGKAAKLAGGGKLHVKYAGKKDGDGKTLPSEYVQISGFDTQPEEAKLKAVLKTFAVNMKRMRVVQGQIMVQVDSVEGAAKVISELDGHPFPCS